ncbi:MAG: leucyl aminopeptidase [Firmicutes bacterium]|nr:leucyl aminopeptidase [Alicyclobacillaceae bacterium]MCL6496873.1 leucyl aminopeptidase [Bacillota bacterium]
MEVRVLEGDPWAVPADVLALGGFEDEGLKGGLERVNQELGGVLAEALARREFEPKPLKTWSTYTLGRLLARQVVVIGLGRQSEFDAHSLRRVAGKLAQECQRLKAETVVFAVPAARMSVGEAAQAVTEGLMVGGWRFAGYQRDPEPVVSPRFALAFAAGERRAAEEGVRVGRIVAEAQNLTRELGWRPSNLLYPELLAKEAVRVAHASGLEVEVLDENRLAELGMGGILAVGQGSQHPPRLVILRYRGSKPQTLALVGKGITFDSGGISLKPAQGMEEMKYDMLGAAAVLGAMSAIAALKPSINVVGLMALAQNMPSGSAYKPGDVVRTFTGKTIEIRNTDAEGRVALADAVGYAAHLGVDWIVEASTLTGAAIIALGHEAAALIATDQLLAGEVVAAAEEAGERVWQLPAYPEYKELYKSPLADLNNSPGRDAGTIAGGLIVSEFAEGKPFAHLDIAGTAWTKAGPLNAQDQGATGSMVRTFVRLAHRLSRDLA